MNVYIYIFSAINVSDHRACYFSRQTPYKLIEQFYDDDDNDDNDDNDDDDDDNDDDRK